MLGKGLESLMPSGEKNNAGSNINKPTGYQSDSENFESNSFDKNSSFGDFSAKSPMPSRNGTESSVKTFFSGGGSPAREDGAEESHIENIFPEYIPHPGQIRKVSLEESANDIRERYGDSSEASPVFIHHESPGDPENPIASSVVATEKITDEEANVEENPSRLLEENEDLLNKRGDEPMIAPDNLPIERPDYRPVIEPVEEHHAYKTLESRAMDYSTGEGSVIQIPVEIIFPNPHQPRRYFDPDALNDLASSIREFGVIQPLVVTRVGAEFQLIAGERRLKASKIAGLKTVPAVVKEVSIDRERLELAIIENIQRENLNPLEAARSYARLQDEFGLTQREIAVRMGKSRETIANTLRLLNLPTDIQRALESGKINESHARILLQIAEPAKQQEIFESIVNNKPTVRELKAQLKKRSPVSRGSIPNGTSADLDNLELLEMSRHLEEFLGTKVEIKDEGDKGRILINYYSAEELQGLINRIGGE